MAARGYSAGLERTLGWGFASVCATYGAMWIVAGLAEGDRTGARLWAAIGVGALAAAATMRSAARNAVGIADVVRLLGAQIVLQVTWAVGSGAEIAGGLRVTMGAVVVFGAVTYARRGARIALIALSVGVELAVNAARLGLGPAILGLLPLAAAAVAISSVAIALRTAAARADDAAAAARAGLRRVVEEEASLRVEEEVRGVLHDHVAAALRAISLASSAPDEARAASRSAVEAIGKFRSDDQTQGDANLTAVLREEATAWGQARVFATSDVVVPAVVAAAFRGAVGEALRNADRHADATWVDVVLTDNGGGVTVSVSDDGRGFDPSRELERSHGLRFSVIRRVEQVGGTATVESAPGTGTTVTLSWSALAGDGAGEKRTVADRARPIVGDLRRPLSMAFVPYLAMNLIYAIWHVASGDLPPWTLVWFALVVVWSGALLVRLYAPPSGIESAAAIALVLAGTVAVFVVLPAGSLHDFAAWPLGAGVQVLSVLIIARPRWEALVAVAVHQGVIVAAAVTGRYEPAPWPEPLGNVATAMASTLLPFALALALPEALARIGDAVERSRRSVATRLRERSHARARASVGRRWVADPGADVVPFLTAVVEERLRVGDPATRAMARSLESAVRDELAMPGVLDAGTRRMVRDARSHGARITLQRTGSGAIEPHVLRALVAAASSSSVPPREVTVSVIGTGAATTACVVVVPGGLGVEGALQRSLGSQVRLIESSPEVMWAEVPARVPE